jgi:hypothetical protein
VSRIHYQLRTATVSFTSLSSNRNLSCMLFIYLLALLPSCGKLRQCFVHPFRYCCHLGGTARSNVRGRLHYRFFLL